MPRSAAFSAAFAPEGRHFVIGGANNQILVVRLAPVDMDALNRAAE